MATHSLPSIRQTISSHAIKAKKHLSQNFIFSPSVTDRIARLIPPCDVLIEIGPGPGTLTRSILQHTKATQVLGIEKDSQFLPALRELQDAYPSTFSFVQSDVLRWDDHEGMIELNLKPGDGKTVQLAGNLPFNISTAIMLHWLERLDGKDGLFHDRKMGWTLMFQKEVAQRIVAREGSSNRSRLSVLVQSLCKTKMCHSLPSSVFRPKPKVDAAVVQIMPNALSESPFHKTRISFKDFQDFLSIGFRAPRKTIWNNLKQLENAADAMEKAGVELSLRPQDVSTSQWIELSQLLSANSQRK